MISVHFLAAIVDQINCIWQCIEYFDVLFFKRGAVDAALIFASEEELDESLFWIIGNFWAIAIDHNIVSNSQAIIYWRSKLFDVKQMIVSRKFLSSSGRHFSRFNQNSWPGASHCLTSPFTHIQIVLTLSRPWLIDDDFSCNMQDEISSSTGNFSNLHLGTGETCRHEADP